MSAFSCFKKKGKRHEGESGVRSREPLQSGGLALVVDGEKLASAQARRTGQRGRERVEGGLRLDGGAGIARGARDDGEGLGVTERGEGEQGQGEDGESLRHRKVSYPTPA